MKSAVLDGVVNYLVSKIPMADFVKDHLPVRSEQLRYALAQGTQEATESLAGDTLNFLGDLVIARDKNAWNQLTQQYMAEGMDEEKAGAAAVRTMLKDSLLNAATSFFTGAATAALENSSIALDANLDILNRKREAEGKSPLPTNHLDTDRAEYVVYHQYLNRSDAQSLETFMAFKYDHPDDFRQLQTYASSAAKGKISSDVSFDQYQRTVESVNDNLTGMKTKDGVEVTGHSDAFLESIIEAAENDISIEDIREVLMNPQSVQKINPQMSRVKRERISGGRNSWKNVGSTYEYVKNGIRVRVNPESGIVHSIKINNGAYRR